MSYSRWQAGCGLTTNTFHGNCATIPLRDWDADELLAMLKATRDGDPAALRSTFERVEILCAAFDSQRPEPVLTPIIDSWGEELQLLKH
jgi:hypothetical protein